MEPQSAVGLMVIAAAQIALERFDEARDSLSGISGCHDDPRCLGLQVMTLAGRGHFDAAEAFCDKVVDILPDEQFGYLLRAKVAVMRGAPEEAERYFEKALQMKPSSGWGLAQMDVAIEKRERAVPRASPEVAPVPVKED